MRRGVPVPPEPKGRVSLPLAADLLAAECRKVSRLLHDTAHDHVRSWTACERAPCSETVALLRALEHSEDLD